MTPEEKKRLKKEYKQIIEQQSAELMKRIAAKNPYDIGDPRWVSAHKEEIRNDNKNFITSEGGYNISIDFTKIKVTCSKGQFYIGWELIFDENKNVAFLMYDDLELIQEYKNLGIGSDDFEHVFKTLKSLGYKVKKG